MKKFQFYKQRDEVDCGPTCLKMIAKHFGRTFSIQKLRTLCQITKGGVTFLDISEAAEKLGLHSIGFKADVAQMKELELPCILHWRQNHFVILYKVKNDIFYIADPAVGLFTLTEKEFANNWMASAEYSDGVALFINTTPRFYNMEDDPTSELSWSFITRYLWAYKSLLTQMVIALAMGTILQLIAPFLTQSIVDLGINNHNLSFIQLILIAQVMIFIGSTGMDFIKSWIMLHISTRINLSIITDLLIKLMKLPMSFFDTKTTGDLMQRISDEKRIESFLTGSTLSIVFSSVNFVVFAVVIAIYNAVIFSVFAISTVIYICWIIIFLKKRRELDYKQFSNNSMNQDNIIELVFGMQEIKLNNSEIRKRWSWERIQARLFRFNIKSLALNQYQQAGAVFINQGKNILITYLSAKAVIDGHLTLGAMVAIQYIIGQLNGPVEQVLNFIKSYQDAKISVERLNEIHQLSDEEPEGKLYTSTMPDDRSISINNLTFRYPGAGNEPVLHNIDLHIPQGKTTAIVGMSGSGKTTILKLLLRFYEPEFGEIRIGTDRLNDLRHRLWRSQCSIVMQDGYLFTDTIANNIAISEEEPDPEKLKTAIQIANIQDVIESLPYGLNSKIGAGGTGLSQGQKQRVLIARAVYKDPEYIFFDEATNALDANNEKVIIGNLNEFLKGKTVVVVAHRLSTVKNADNIVVLNKGRIVEQGTHQHLTHKKGEYYNLIKNQLELGL
ncbi:MAG TPA: peptidase domain-containing ABC transporter [Mucilaginibacter sp.]|nr:peptidase domain-containing ABC transporter [Mucilaginibacter sp.]